MNYLRNIFYKERLNGLGIVDRARQLNYSKIINHFAHKKQTKFLFNILFLKFQNLKYIYLNRLKEKNIMTTFLVICIVYRITLEFDISLYLRILYLHTYCNYFKMEIFFYNFNTRIKHVIIRRRKFK